MSSPRELPAHSGDAGAALADYLDHLCAPLVDAMPYPERQAVRQEIGMLRGGLTQALIDRRLRPERFQLQGAGAAGLLTDGRIGDGTTRDG